ELEKISGPYELSEQDKDDYLPRGYFMFDDDEYFTGSKGKLIINKFDLINCKDHPDQNRLNGCYVLAGLDGINKVCCNGHEIATEKSDCWH
ncbi:MAG TPA: hypothetical protein VFR58_10820, partial [Flavisolibacter sp.]|nr:hypothetical protein [Flavisolibacter sp.]